MERWFSTGHALITFPTYYPAHLGDGITCFVSLEDKPEMVQCVLYRDWSLDIWAPADLMITNKTAFHIIVAGVVQNQVATPGEIYVSIANGSDISIPLE